eukprot:CAMPEP_0175730610 /NCGR_PEP_ID=MMETSP0097-20121207/50412_1 /TAXON_ID=311494 /ORGANISM="Alexandrium monilatum, Strain CCMP3105" /LENGTH=70 /DNA_ID=CAMNT_0017038517 /DNA_START=286 /DNA_END=496 /DNA_ORIENTATION=-
MTDLGGLMEDAFRRMDFRGVGGLLSAEAASSIGALAAQMAARRAPNFVNAPDISLPPWGEGAGKAGSNNL